MAVPEVQGSTQEVAIAKCKAAAEKAGLQWFRALMCAAGHIVRYRGYSALL
jgi:hypothetical protein